jgi:hypothetical protein
LQLARETGDEGKDGGHRTEEKDVELKNEREWKT